MEELYLTFRGRQVFLTCIVTHDDSFYGAIKQPKKEPFRYEVDNNIEVLQRFVSLYGYDEVSKHKIHKLPSNWSYELNLWPTTSKALVQLATIIFN